MGEKKQQRDEVLPHSPTLEEQNEQLRERITILEKLVEQQKEQLSIWRKEIEEWRRGFRSRRKRFSSASHAKAGAKPKAKRSGRGLGHTPAHRAVPLDVDATEEHPAPPVCECGADVAPTGVVREIVIEDLPVVQPLRIRHRVHEGRCEKCGKPARAAVVGMPAVEAPVAPVVLGPRATALALTLRFEHHLPLRRVSRVLQQGFGLTACAGGLSRRFARWADRTRAAGDEVHKRALRSARLGVDETGLRHAGKMGWAWLLRNEELSYFHLSSGRRADVFAKLVPEGQTHAVVESDFYAVYTRRSDVLHAYCGAHLICEAKKIAEVDAEPLAVCFAKALAWSYQYGEAAVARGDLDAIEEARRALWATGTTPRYARSKALVRLQTRMVKHFVGVAAFLGRNDLCWNNNATERDLRPLCVFRKVAGGTRGDCGRAALGHRMSVTQTLRKQHLALGPWVEQAEEAHREARSVPSVFAEPDPAL